MHVAIRLIGLALIIYSVIKSHDCKTEGNHKEAYYHMLQAIFFAVITV
jgi:hypothetical protein